MSGQKLIGLLKQIHALSDFASDIFGGLLKEATTTAARLNAVAGRVQAIDVALPQVQHIYATSRPQHFYGGIKGATELSRVDPGHQALFVSVDESTQKGRETADSRCM